MINYCIFTLFHTSITKYHESAMERLAEYSYDIH